MYSPVVTDMFCNLSHRVLLVDIVFNIECLARLLFYVNVDVVMTDVLWFDKFYTKESFVYLSESMHRMQDSSGRMEINLYGHLPLYIRYTIVPLVFLSLS